LYIKENIGYPFEIDHGWILKFVHLNISGSIFPCQFQWTCSYRTLL